MLKPKGPDFLHSGLTVEYLSVLAESATLEPVATSKNARLLNHLVLISFKAADDEQGIVAASPPLGRTLRRRSIPSGLALQSDEKKEHPRPKPTKKTKAKPSPLALEDAQIDDADCIQSSDEVERTNAG